MLKIACTDIETNNLYIEVDTWHCAWIIEPTTGIKKGFRPHEWKEYLEELAGYDIVIGHNVIDYDFPTLAKLFPNDFKIQRVFDTLVLSRMLEPDRLGGHSLKSWGVALGILKGTYGEGEDVWDVFSEDMFDYCEQDVTVTVALYLHLCEKAGFDPMNPPSSLIDFYK
ncbi:putative DNA polymerase [Salmonella phage pSal-SNUABM-01]|nr:putative DNA polymerase [Salmonella phage pSal-SNUABM-01]